MVFYVFYMSANFQILKSTNEEKVSGINFLRGSLKTIYIIFKLATCIHSIYNYIVLKLYFVQQIYAWTLNYRLKAKLKPLKNFCNKNFT